jgi:hypothetical protein
VIVLLLVFPPVVLVLPVHTTPLNHPITTLQELEHVQDLIVLHTLKPVTHNALLEKHVKVKDTLIHAHQMKHVYPEQYLGQYHTQTVHHLYLANIYALKQHVQAMKMSQV